MSGTTRTANEEILERTVVHSVQVTRVFHAVFLPRPEFTTVVRAVGATPSSATDVRVETAVGSNDCLPWGCW
ncbi:hypothetical protein [Myxococcus sp. CA040A]|uniref:hypothetical protein n=1 Tax=Myxococcus sp. CA040A TaxID=2741738 RepID=UPI00157A3ABB|nr:hypothetical protein [Myxococcus sp. CA040A]NTX09086.1 hypothetical protein [Myxococcus sp. CA040A]